MQNNFQRDAVRIKVIQHSNAEVDSQCCRFSVAPELTGYEVLRNLIARGFDIKGEFQTCFLARDDRLPEACWLPLLSDFDLELAFQRSSDPYLLVKVDLIRSNGNWDVGSIDLPKLSLPDLPKNTYSTNLPGIFKEKMEKTLSMVQKAFNWNEDDIDPISMRPPLTDSEFQKMLDPLGTLKDARDLRLKVYRGGIEPSLRKVVWKHLLNVYPDNLSGRKRMDCIKEKTQEYYHLREVWQNHLENSKDVSEDVRYTTNMVKKDVLRTDRHHPFFSGPDDNANVISLYNILNTYALNHPSVGYCQGMSDLASPLLVTMKDEAQAYVCFCALMSRVRSNFLIDGDAMTLKFQHLTEALIYYDYEFFTYLRRLQADDLLFCYRWLLLELKREFAFDDAQLMLEVLWSSLPPNPPLEGLSLLEVPFNPVTVTHSPSVPTTPRQNHYANVCALRRQRSCISNRKAECLAAIFHRRTVSVDFPNSGKSLKCTSQKLGKHRTFSEKENCHISSPVHRIKEEFISPESNPSSPIRKIKNLKEFKKFNTNAKDSDAKDPEAENGKFESIEAENCDTKTAAISNSREIISRRCYSDSDADVGVPVFDGGDVDVWQNPVAIISPDEDQKLEIVAQEEKPSKIKLSPVPSHLNKAKAHPPPDPDEHMATSINSCEEVTETGWQVTMSGEGNDASPPSLPPPKEFGGGNPFLMFLCVTLLLQQRQFIMQHKLDHNELAMHFDKMVRKHNVQKVLSQARKMFEAYLKLDFGHARSKVSPSSSNIDHSC